MSDLYNKQEIEEAERSAVKTWKWLQSLFGEKEISDEEFQKRLIEECKEYSEELENDRIKEQKKEAIIANENITSAELSKEQNFANDMLETSKMVEKSQKEQYNEYIDSFTNDMLETSKMVESKVKTQENNNQENNNQEHTNNKALDSNKNDNFINDFLDTAGMNKENLLKTQDSNNAIEQNDNLNYFGRKSLEQKHSTQSKEAFKSEFKRYFEANANTDEIKTLVRLLNMKSPPSKLNNEHRDLIKESLSLAQTKNNAYEHLDGGYKAIIRTNLGQQTGTQNINSFIDFMNNPKNKLDKGLKQDLIDNNFIKSLKKINSTTLAEGTLKKLESLMPQAKMLSPTQSFGLSLLK